MFDATDIAKWDLAVLPAAVQSTLTAVFSATLAMAVPSGADDAAAIRAQIVQASANAAVVCPVGQQVEVVAHANATYLLNTALEPSPNVHVNAKGAYFKKNANGGTPQTNSIWRTYDTCSPITGAGAFSLTFTGTPSTGATSATLTAPWAGATGAPPIIFGNGDVRNVILTNGSTAVTWTGALSATAGLTTAGVGGTYFKKYFNFRLTGGVWDSNGFTCPAQLMRFANIEDCTFIDVVVKHSSGIASWAWELGGNRNKTLYCSVYGGTDTFQDAFHWTYGDDNLMVGCYSEGGDDGVAVGYDGAAIETCDDIGLTNLTVQAHVSKSIKATAIKIYFGQRADGNVFAGSRGTVTTVTMSGITGYGGLATNGGIYITDTTKLTLTAGVSNGAGSGTLTAAYSGPTSSAYYVIFDDGQVRQATFTYGSTTVTFASNKSGAAGATIQQVDPTRLQNIDIACNLQVGSAANDGVSSYGVLISGATNVTIKGTIKLTETALGASGTQGIWGASINLFNGVDFSVHYPKLSTRSTCAGVACFNGKDINIHDCKIVGTGTGRGQIEQTGVLGLTVHDVTGEDIGQGSAFHILQGVGAGIWNNTWERHDNKIRKLAGATTSRVYIQQSGIKGSGACVYGKSVNEDGRGNANATGIDQFMNTPAFGTLTFTGTLTAGATTATLTGNFAGATGSYNVTFGTTFETRVVTLTNGSTAVAFTALTSNESASAFYTGGFVPDALEVVGYRGFGPNMNLLGDVAMSFAASQSVPLLNSNGNKFSTTATANTALLAPTGGFPGARFMLITRMGGVGGFTRTYDPVYVGTCAALPSGAGGTTGQLLVEEYEMMQDAYHWRLVSPAVWVTQG